jgi:hypothetical protein
VRGTIENPHFSIFPPHPDPLPASGERERKNPCPTDTDRAPQEALDLLLDAHRPPEDDHPALRPRGWKRRRR